MLDEWCSSTRTARGVHMTGSRTMFRGAMAVLLHADRLYIASS
jgi:hypothetical protein